MRYAIFSDVHANFEAWQAVLKAYQSEKIDQFICLGDIVGYGADPGKCIASLRELGAINIAGNHDWAVVEKFDDFYFNQFALQAIAWTKQVLDESEKQFLRNLPLTYSDNNLYAAHAGLWRADKFLYTYSIAAAIKSFNLIQNKPCFIGHTHIPMFIKKNKTGAIFLNYPDLFKLEADSEYIVNVGSVGQPRDGNPDAAYAVYDTKKRLVEIKRISYNIPTKAQTKIRKARIAEYLAQRLGQGR
ncbi:MAG: metallophosphatase family protein [Candidatus Omnitrophica bacterium]|nr:metallophosphatase family protein [Candidatus Omnitrophota bacterium]